MNENLITVMLVSATIIAMLMIATWLVSLRRNDASVVDIVWGMGFAAVAWAAFLKAGDRHDWSWLLPFLATVWGCLVVVPARGEGGGEGGALRMLILLFPKFRPPGIQQPPHFEAPSSSYTGTSLRFCGR